MGRKNRNDIVVYIHKNRSTDKIFYVGIGIPERPYCFKRRGKYWHNYVKKHGEPKIKIIKKNLIWSEACRLEKRLIKLFGRRKIDKNGILVNRTAGGDGRVGIEHSRKTISKMSKAGKKRSTRPKHSDKTKLQMTESQKKRGWKISPELRTKMNIGKKKSAGWHHTEESLIKVRLGKERVKDQMVPFKTVILSALGNPYVVTRYKKIV